MKGSALVAACAAVVATVMVGACASAPPILQTSAVPSPAATKPEAPVRGTPVVTGRPARMYVMVGFKEADCAPLQPALAIVTPPTKGEVTFRPNQTTTVMHSVSGKCTGSRMPGTGIYYTARPGTSGPDSFTVSATTGSGPPSVRTYHVRIVE